MKPALSKLSRLALKTLGELIRTARIERHFSQANLAERLNVSRYSVIAIEKGDPTVAIGVVFEAAAIVGIPLLADNKLELAKLGTTLASLHAVLPKRVRVKDRDMNDNF